MNKSIAIKKNCADCAGGPSGATLCTILNCFLWPHRLGCGMKTLAYQKRVKSAWKTAKVAREEAESCGLGLEDFLPCRKKSMPNTHDFENLQTKGGN